MFTPTTEKRNTPVRRLSDASRKRWWIWLLAVCFLGIGVYFLLTRAGESPAPSSKKGISSPPQAVPVSVATAKQGDINTYVVGLGTVTPVYTVTVKSRVDGELMKVNFQEGQMVKAGDLLAEIDPRPFEAQLIQAEGQLIRDQALLENARLDLQRYETLSKQDSIPKQQYDTQKSLVHQLEGTVKFDQGQIDSIKVQLIYCRITAPVSGRVGLRLIDPGNIVHAADTNGLVVITQLQPITVIFPIPEDSLPPVLQRLQAGERMPVESYNREQTKKLATGYLLTVDNQIDTTTGTVRLRAQFPNQGNELFPNQFVNASLLLETKHGVTLIPATALQRGPQGSFVYLVKADQTATVRSVRIGPGEGDEVSIDEGLMPGDVVVVEGADRLREGSKVAVQVQGADNSQRGN